MKKYQVIALLTLCLFTFLQAGIPYQNDNFAVPAYLGMGHSGGATDGGVNTYWMNPALFNLDSPLSMSLSQAFIPGMGIGITEFSGMYALNDTKALSAGINFENYGQFTARDINGNELGEFTASQYQLMLGYHQYISPSFRGGVQLLYFNSQIESSYEANVFLRYGLVYRFGKRDDQLALSGASDGQELLWRLSYSHKLEYLPLRLNMDIRRDSEISLPGGDYSFSENAMVFLNMVSLGAWADVNEDLDLFFGIDFRRIDLRSQNFGVADLLTGLGLGGQYRFKQMSLGVSSFIYGNLGTMTSMNVSYFSPNKKN